MTGFNLEKFKEIITSEIDELYDQYEKERTEKNNQSEGKYNKKTKEFKVSEIPKEKLKKTLKYYHDHVFKTIQGNYFVQLTEDKSKVSPMSAKTFNEVFGQTIKEFHPNLLKQDTTRYEVDIYDDNFTVDRKKKRINLAMSFNYTYTDSPLIQEEQEQLNYLLDEFVFKVICNSNENVYEFLLDMIGCYAHRKQSNSILILVGEGGTGKSKFIELLQSLFGSSCKMMTDQVLSGQDMFNSSMIGTSIGYIEETNGKGESNYTDIQRTLKRLSTSKFITCRKMQTDSFDVLNIINFVVITNFIKDIKHDRRNFPLEPSTHRINDKVFYKKISSIIDNKRLMQGLFNMVYKRSFDVWSRTLPQTEVLNDFTEKNSMKLIHEFFIDEFIYPPRKRKKYLR